MAVLFTYKSGDSEEEIQQAKHAISLLGGKVKNVDKFQLPGTDMGRALVEIKKTKQTPGKYPRKAGLPAKRTIKISKYRRTCLLAFW